MKTWIETIFSKAPIPRAVTALLLVVITNVLLHPLFLVPLFEPLAMHGYLYRSGAELFFAVTWSSLAGILMLVLSAYSRRIRTSLIEVGEIFGLEQKESRTLYHKLTGIITGAACSVAGLLLGLVASFLEFYIVVPAMVTGGWYRSKAIHFGATGQVFFNYALAGSALWMLVSYVYVISRIPSYTSRLPAVTMLGRLKVLGISSLHGAVYFVLIGVVALGHFLGTEYFRISWAPAVGLVETIFAALFPLLFFFGSLMGIHRVIVNVKETEVHRLRSEYWRRHLDFDRFLSEEKETSDEKSFARREARMRELDNVARWIERMPEWPFDLGILRLLAISVVFPIVTYFLGNYLVGIAMRP